MRRAVWHSCLARYGVHASVVSLPGVCCHTASLTKCVLVCRGAIQLDTVSDEQAEEFDFQAGKLTAADEYTNLGWGPDGTESVGYVLACLRAVGVVVRWLMAGAWSCNRPTIGSFGEEDFGLEDLEEDETAPRFQAGGYLASAKKARGRGGRGSGGGRGGGRGGRASGRRK